MEIKVKVIDLMAQIDLQMMRFAGETPLQGNTDSGKAAAQTLQWTTTVSNLEPDPLLTPPVIIGISSIVLILNMFEIILVFLEGNRRDHIV